MYLVVLMILFDLATEVLQGGVSGLEGLAQAGASVLLSLQLACHRPRRGLQRVHLYPISFRVQGLGYRVQGLGYRVQGLGVMV